MKVKVTLSDACSDLLFRLAEDPCCEIDHVTLREVAPPDADAPGRTTISALHTLHDLGLVRRTRSGRLSYWQITEEGVALVAASAEDQS